STHQGCPSRWARARDVARNPEVNSLVATFADRVLGELHHAQAGPARLIEVSYVYRVNELVSGVIVQPEFVAEVAGVHERRALGHFDHEQVWRHHRLALGYTQGRDRKELAVPGPAIHQSENGAVYHVGRRVEADGWHVRRLNRRDIERPAATQA